MRITLLLGLLALPLFAQTNPIYVRIPGTSFCNVDGASGTPIKLTVTTIGDCQTFVSGTSGAKRNLQAGDIVKVVDVSGNQAANVHATVAGETKYRAFIVANVSGNTFDLKDLTGADTVGSGSFTLSGQLTKGRVGPAMEYRVRNSGGLTHGGSRLAEMTANCSTCKKHTNNPAYNGLVAGAALYNAGTWKPGWANVLNGTTLAESGSMTAAAALHWQVTGDATSLARVVADLSDPASLVGGNHGGGFDSGISDYARQYVAYQAYAFHIIKNVAEVDGGMSTAAKDRLMRFWLNNFPWTSQGTGYSAASYTNKSVRTSTGTVSIVGTAVTGSSTNWQSAGATAGDWLLVGNTSGFCGEAYGTIHKIANVVNNTSLALEYNAGMGNQTGKQFCIGQAWDPAADLGIANRIQAYGGGGYANFCGNCSGFTAPSNPQRWTDNLMLVGLYGGLMSGLAACSYGEADGCIMAEHMMERFVDQFARRFSVFNGYGFNENNYSYNSIRYNNMIGEIYVVLKEALTDATGTAPGPDYAAAMNPNFFKHIGRNAIHQTYPTSSTTTTAYSWGISSNFDIGLVFMKQALVAMFGLNDASHAVSKEIKHWTSTLNGFDTAFGGSALGYVYWAYVFNDPAVVGATPQKYIVDENDYDYCASTFSPSSLCADAAAEGSFHGMWARSGFGLSDTIVAADYADFGTIGHQFMTAAGQLTIIKAAKFLLGGDDANGHGGCGNAGICTTGLQNRSIPAPGGDSNLKTIGSSPPAVVTNIWKYASSAFSFYRGDLVAQYAAASAMTKVERQTFYLQPNLIVVHDYMTGASQALQSNFHLPLNGVGTATSSSATEVLRSALGFRNLQTGAGLLGKVVPFGGLLAAVTTQNSSDDNGSYTNQNGYTTRFRVCLSADSSTCSNGTVAEWAVVMQTNANAGGETLCNNDIATQTVSNHRIVECKDSTNPGVIAFTRGGTASASLSFTTTFSGTGSYGITGMQTGVYNVTVAATPVSGSPFTVTAGAQSLAFNGPSGAVVIGAYVPPSPSVTFGNGLRFGGGGVFK